MTLKFLAFIELEVPDETNPGFLSEGIQETVAKWGDQGSRASLQRLHGLSFAEYEAKQAERETAKRRLDDLCFLVMRTVGYLSRESEENEAVKEKMDELRKWVEDNR